MKKAKRKKLNRIIGMTNVVKYTIGLPLLIFYTIRFLIKLATTSTLVYINISLYPEKLRENFNSLGRLKTGLKLLWSLNRLNVKE